MSHDPSSAPALTPAEPGAGAPAASPWGALAAVSSALAVFGAAQGLSYPLFTLVMQDQGYSPAVIGVSSAVMPFGLLLSAPLVPRWVDRFGARRLAIGCAAGAAVCFLLIGLLQNAVAWFGLRFLMGFLVNPLYILGEVWALALAAPAQRGRVMGFFNTLMSVGYAAGPLTLTILGASGLAPFAVACAAFAGCSAMLALVGARVSNFSRENETSPSVGMLAFARQAPALLAAVAVAAATQQSLYSLLPVFGGSYGLSERALAALLTVLSAGNILLQVPLGLGAERRGGRRMILFCAGLTSLLVLLLPVAITNGLIWPLLLILGGVGYGVYTMATVELGERFSGASLVAGNAAFALLWGAGGIVGAPLAGGAIEVFGPLGYPVTMFVLSGGAFLFVLYRTRRRARR